MSLMSVGLFPMSRQHYFAAASVTASCDQSCSKQSCKNASYDFWIGLLSLRCPIQDPMTSFPLNASSFSIDRMFARYSFCAFLFFSNPVDARERLSVHKPLHVWLRVMVVF